MARLITMTQEIKDKVLAQVAALLDSDKATQEVKFEIPTTKVTDKVKVYITFEAYAKQHALVHQCDKEIQWNGTISRVEDGFLIDDILVFPQVVTAASVDADELEYAQWLMSLDLETFNRLRYNGHSHVNMGCSPSGKDTGFHAEMLPQISDFYVYGIFNKKKNSNFTIYDVENNIVYENKDIDFIILNPNETWADEQIDKYVTTPKPKITYSAPTQLSFGRHGYVLGKKEEVPAPDYDNMLAYSEEYEYGKHYNYVSKRWEIPTDETTEQFSVAAMRTFYKQLDAYERRKKHGQK